MVRQWTGHGDGEPVERHWSERQWRTIVPVPRNHNTRDEIATIKRGEVPEDWADKPTKLGQKDVDARWRQQDQKTVWVGMFSRRSNTARATTAKRTT